MIKIDSDLHVRSYVTSERKSRYQAARHERTVHFSVRVVADSWDEGSSFYASTARDEAMRVLREGQPYLAGGRVLAGLADDVEVFVDRPQYSEDNKTTFYARASVSFTFRAPKKSEILTEEDASERLDASALGKAVIEILQHAVEVAVAKQADDRARKSRLYVAEQLLEVLAKDVRERADAEVRYSQRLAGLKAEYQAEKQVQIGKVLERMEADMPTLANGQPIDRRSFEAAKAKLSQYVKGDGGGFFGRSVQQYITEEDVA